MDGFSKRNNDVQPELSVDVNRDSPVSEPTTFSEGVIVDPPSVVHVVHPVAEASMDDVDLVRRTIKGFDINTISIGVLKKFCVKNDVKQDDGSSVRKLKKEATLLLIKQKKIRLNNGEDDPWNKESIINVGTTSSVVINRYRLANVVFGDTCRPIVAKRGKCLDKDELTLGLKTDQKVYEIVAAEYNWIDTPEEDPYGSIEYPYIVVDDCHQPSKFSTPVSWKEVQKVTKDCMKHLDKARANMELSGTHDSDIEEANQATILNFTKHHYVVYWNEFAEEHQELFKTLSSDIDSSVKSQTGSTVHRSSGKKKKRKVDETLMLLKKSNDIEERKCVIEQQRTDSLKESLLINNLAIIEENRRKAMYELVDVVGSQKEARTKYKRHQQRKIERNGRPPSSPESNASLYEAIDYWREESDRNKAQKDKFVSSLKTPVVNVAFRSDNANDQSNGRSTSIDESSTEVDSSM